MDFIILLGTLVVAAILRDKSREIEASNEHGDNQGNRIHRGGVTGDGGNRDANSPGPFSGGGGVIPATVLPVVQPPVEVTPQPPPVSKVANQPE